MSKVYLEDSVLTDIADAIREKTGGSGTITPANMPTEIGSISGGGGEPIVVDRWITSMSGGLFERLVVDNNVTFSGINLFNLIDLMKNINKNFFSQQEYENLANQLVLKLAKKLELFSGGTRIDNRHCFPQAYSTGSLFIWSNPYTIDNFDVSNFFIFPETSGKSVSVDGYYFLLNRPSAYNESNLRNYLNYTRPIIKNISDTNNIWRDWCIANSGVRISSGGAWGIISCWGQWYLNDLPEGYVEWLKFVSNINIGNYSDYLNFLYYECYKLKTAYIPVVSFSSFNAGVRNTPRLRHILFVQKGKGYISNSASLSMAGAGYNRTSGNVTNKQDVCPDAKKIYDATTYEALKNDPDAWASGLEWSFYGHSAAAETINSLPNQNPCPDGYNRPCTIIFEQNSGLNTDDGPISNLTAEEIAVATEKGWTVTLV